MGEGGYGERNDLRDPCVPPPPPPTPDLDFLGPELLPRLDRRLAV